MAQSMWNFFFSQPRPLSVSPNMPARTLEWLRPITLLQPGSAGDPLSQDSLLQSLRINLLTFCWGVKIASLVPHCPRSQLLYGGWTFTINEHWKKQIPMGILWPLYCPRECVSLLIWSLWNPPPSLQRKPAARCIDWLIKWKTLLATWAFSSTHGRH